MRELRTVAEVDAALAASGVIYKHSTRCPVSFDAYDEVARFALAHPDVPVHIVDVVLQRDLSQHLSKVTGIVHQSPQVIVVDDGTVRWHGSHYAISALALERHVLGE
jgi:bacillithiol system protein YtxJ